MASVIEGSTEPVVAARPKTGRKVDRPLLVALLVVGLLTPYQPDADMKLEWFVTESAVQSNLRSWIVFPDGPPVPDIRALVRQGHWYTIYSKLLELLFALPIWATARFPAILLLLGLALVAWRRSAWPALVFLGLLGVLGLVAPGWARSQQGIGTLLCLIHSAVGMGVVALAARALALARPSAGPIERWIALGGVVAASFFLYYTKAYTRDLYWLGFILFIVIAIQRRRPTQALVAFGLLVAVKVSWMILAPALALGLGWTGSFRGVSLRHWIRPTLLTAAAVIVGVAVTLSVDRLVTGDALLQFRISDALAFNYLESIPGYLASPGRSLLLFWPPALLLFAAGWRGWRPSPAAAFAVAAAIIIVVFHASYRYWNGTWSWGPRFLLPTIFLVGLVLHERGMFSARPLVVGLLAVGLVVNAPSTLLNADNWIRRVLAQGGKERDVDFFPPTSPVPVQYGLVRDHLLGRKPPQGECDLLIVRLFRAVTR